MLIVLLDILEVIGYVILFTLAFFFASLLIVLFVPIRYKACGQYKDKEADILFNISFLLHIVSISFTFKNKKPQLIFRLFGIKIKKRSNKKRIKSDKNIKEQDSDNSDENSSVNETDENEDESDTNFLNKLKIFKKNLDYYLKVIKSNYFKETILICKKRIGKLLKSILPNKGKIVLWLGFENAGTMGEILGLYRAFYSYIGKVVILNTYYDRECTDIEFKIRGRIFSFIVIYNLLFIYFNRNVKKIIKVLKHKPK